MGIHILDTQLFVGLKAFIRKDEKVLVLKDREATGHGLDFPGGKYRKGKKIIDELSREVEEEVGISIKVGRPFYTWTSKYRGVEDYRNDVFLIGYLCDYVSGTVRLSEEHSKFEWVDRKSANAWKEPTEYWKALEEYFKFVRAPSSVG